MNFHKLSHNRKIVKTERDSRFYTIQDNKFPHTNFNIKISTLRSRYFIQKVEKSQKMIFQNFNKHRKRVKTERDSRFYTKFKIKSSEKKNRKKNEKRKRHVRWTQT